jgi:4-hydroxyphenylpyruvate dioxygenase
LYRGLETGERNVVSHVVKLNNIIFVFKSSLNPNNDGEITRSLGAHGDAVKDVALSVNDLEAIIAKAREAGAKVVRDIWEERDENGFVRMATVQTVALVKINQLLQATLFYSILSFYFALSLFYSSATSHTL